LVVGAGVFPPSALNMEVFPAWVVGPAVIPLVAALAVCGTEGSAWLGWVSPLVVGAGVFPLAAFDMGVFPAWALEPGVVPSSWGLTVRGRAGMG